MPGVRLVCLDNTGKIVRDAILRFPLRPITDAIWNSPPMRDGYLLSNGTQHINTVGEGLTRPSALPLVTDLLVNRNGDVWVLRSHPIEPLLIWDRLDRTGKPLTSVIVPNRQQLRAVDGNAYYAADTDDDGLQTLIRCAIP